MKRILGKLCWLLLVIVCTMSMLSFTTCKSESVGLRYALSQDGTYYTVKGIGSCTDTNVVIPSTYKDLPVKSIEESAFSLCGNLKSVVISDSIESIEDYAFSYCTTLTEVKIGNGVKSVGMRAFIACDRLKRITIGSGVTDIDAMCFESCKSLEKITVAKENTVYHSKGNCLIETESKKLILGSKKSVIPKDGSVTAIGAFCFYHREGLRSIVIPDSVKSIEEYAFCESGLKEVKIGKNVESIERYAFCGTGLRNITLPDCMKSIGDQAFYECTRLKSIEIPDNVTSIGKEAFCFCSGLTSVTIGKGVTSIEDGAFSDCDGLTNVYYNGTAEEWSKISIGKYNESLTSATIHYCGE